MAYLSGDCAETQYGRLFGCLEIQIKNCIELIDLNQMRNADLSYIAACARFRAAPVLYREQQGAGSRCDSSLPIHISKVRTNECGRPAMPADLTSLFVAFITINSVVILATSAYLTIAFIARYAQMPCTSSKPAYPRISV